MCYKFVVNFIATNLFFANMSNFTHIKKNEAICFRPNAKSEKADYKTLNNHKKKTSPKDLLFHEKLKKNNLKEISLTVL